MAKKENKVEGLTPVVPAGAWRPKKGGEIPFQKGYTGDRVNGLTPVVPAGAWRPKKGGEIPFR